MSFAVSKSIWLTATATLVVAAISASATISFFFSRKRWRNMELKVEKLEVSLRASSEKCAAERQGRIRSQQALRNALAQQTSSDLELTSYPMTPIGFVQSCFSSRNGTPRQPLLVPLARACVAFDPARVPPASLEGLGEYSHCWIIYVFHLNTDLEKLWKHPSESKFKAKVRVPRLKGGKMGVFATRTPHRPNPIGLTVAKVEAVQGHMVLLSGVDLVDGTPVLDVKPYLPYSDANQGATVPEWVKVDKLLAVASVSFSEGFFSTLSKCWVTVEKSSLYTSHEFQNLIMQVLSWDIRSSSQRNQPHEPLFNDRAPPKNSDLDNHQGDIPDHGSDEGSAFIYHLMLEDLDVSYKIDGNGHVVVERVELSSKITNGNRNRCTYKMWKDKLG